MAAKRVGFVGVGTMGQPMARNLLKAGFAVTVCPHVNRARVEALQAEGAQVVAHPRDVAAASEVVVVCVPNAPQVEETLFAAHGLMAGASPGLVIVDSSTISPAAAQDFAARVAAAGCTYLDAPVSGGESGAVAGTLTFLVGGDAAALAAHRDVFEAMGQRIFHFGGSGKGAVVKLANNLMGAIHLVALCEAFSMGAKAGVDPAQMAEAIKVSSGTSRMVEAVFPNRILKRDYRPSFALKLMTKDVGLALASAKALGTPMLVGTLAAQIAEMVQNLGHGDDDFSVIATWYEAMAGVRLGEG